jgi:hypothetical protein
MTTYPTKTSGSSKTKDRDAPGSKRLNVEHRTASAAAAQRRLDYNGGGGGRGPCVFLLELVLPIGVDLQEGHRAGLCFWISLGRIARPNSPPGTKYKYFELTRASLLEPTRANAYCAPTDQAALRTELQRISHSEIVPASHLIAQHAIGPVPSAGLYSE